MDHAGLLNCLKAESELLAALLIALREQQAALVAARSGEVLALSQQAEDLIKQLQQASKARLEAQTGFESLDAAAESAPRLRMKALSSAVASRWISEKARSPPRMLRPSCASPSERLRAKEPTPAIAMTPSAMQAMKIRKPRSPARISRSASRSDRNGSGVEETLVP